MPGHGEKRERKWEDAILALLSEATVEAAAAKVGVAYSTLKEWLRDPDFQADCAAARRELLERGVARLLATVGKAVAALERAVGCGVTKDEVRAAALILEHAHKGVELLDLAAELAKLKAEMKGTDSWPRRAC